MSTHIKGIILVLVIAVTLIFLQREPLAGGAGADNGISFISRDETGLVLELRTSTFDSTDIEANGTIYQRLTIPGDTHGVTEKVGSPELPVKGYWLDLPEGMNIELDVEKIETEISSGYLVYPVPEKVARGEEVVEEFTIDHEAYGENRFFPGQRVQRGTTASLRDQRKAQVLFFPISFNPQSGELRLHTLIRARVTYVPDQEPEIKALGFRTPPFGLAAADPAWPPLSDELYKITTTEGGAFTGSAPLSSRQRGWT